MSRDRLERRLQELPVPGMEEARERAVAAARAAAPAPTGAKSSYRRRAFALGASRCC